MKIVLLTCEDLREFVTYEKLLEDALKKRDYQFTWQDWRQPCDWNLYDLAILRTTWNYFDHLPEFLKVLGQIEASNCRLLNPLPLVRWNCNKSYLVELAKKEYPVIPTQILKSFSSAQVEAIFSDFSTDQIVVKPVVGAGSKNTFCFERKNIPYQALKVIEGTEVLAQPYIPSIAREGEFSMHYFAGEHSHTVLKKPKSGDFRSQEEFGSAVSLVQPDAEMFLTAQSILQSLSQPWLYARVDIVRGESSFLLMEIELIEPSLYFKYSEGAADRFVDAIGKTIED